MSKIRITGARYVIRILELLETKDIFAYPGGQILPIYDEIPYSSMRHILVRHEQGAAFAAQGYSRVAGKPGVCLATSGPGATNLITGIADAWSDSIPMIAITGQVATTLIGSDAFQETDITGMCIPITKKAYLLTKIQDAPKVFMDAYRIAINGRPGPVLIDIPKDVQNAVLDLDSDWEKEIVVPKLERLNKAEAAEIEKAIELLSNAQKPLIIGGHGILLSEAWEEARAFLIKEQIPAISTILGIGVFGNDNPLYFSWLGMHGMKYANDAVQNADVIIALGIRFDDRITGKLDKFAPNAKIIHVDIDKSERSKNVKATSFIHSDLKLFFEQFPSTLNESNRKARQEWIQHLDEQREKYPLKPVNFDKFDMISAVSVLQQLLPEDAIVTTDVGQHQMWSAQYLDKIRPNHFLTSAGLGSMGFGFPAAMGAQAAKPNQQVWSISGDGGFQMNLQELMTVVQDKFPVKILILDNAYLGMVRQWQEQFYSKNYSGVDLMSPDFVKLAEAYGIKGIAADNVNDFIKAIQEAQNEDGPVLIHAKVLKEENVLPMIAPGTSLSETIYYPEHEIKALMAQKKAAQIQTVIA